MVVIAQWIRLRLPFCSPGLKSQAHHLCYFHLWSDCTMSLCLEKDEKHMKRGRVLARLHHIGANFRLTWIVFANILAATSGSICRVSTTPMTSSTNFILSFVDICNSYKTTRVVNGAFLNPTHAIMALTGVTNAHEPSPQPTACSGQSYKAFMIVNYDSRVLIWGIFKSSTTVEL